MDLVPDDTCTCMILTLGYHTICICTCSCASTREALSLFFHCLISTCAYLALIVARIGLCKRLFPYTLGSVKRRIHSFLLCMYFCMNLFDGEWFFGFCLSKEVCGGWITMEGRSGH